MTVTQTDNNIPRIGEAVQASRESLSIPSKIEWIEKAVDHLVPPTQVWGICDEDRASRLTIVLTEALTNAVVHGNLGISSALKEDGDAFAVELSKRSSQPDLAAKPVLIEAEYDGTTVTWTITDQGEGFDVEDFPKRLDSEEPDMDLLLSGRGVMLIRAFVDDISWHLGGRQIQFSMDRPGLERREQHRLQTHQSVRVATFEEDGQIDWGKALDALTLDLSTGGASMLHPSIENATRLMIEINGPQGKMYVPAQVCRTQQVDDDIVQIGCRFLAPDPDQSGAYTTLAQQTQALEELIAQLEESQDTNNFSALRSHARAIFTDPVSVDTLDGNPLRSAIGRDLSKGGVSFIGQFELPQGAQVGITLQHKDEKPLRVLGIITRCNRLTGNHYDYGVKFL
ncbi:MAG: PilZ domain-containing protein [Phycisphaeraceae bacterium]|nr:PilZ domain-containing protein [Phycisphaeraceae bacterium]